MIDLDPAALEAGQRAGMVSNGCGVTVEGEREFCDDHRLPSHIRCADCQCKTDSFAAIAAYVGALVHPEGTEVN